uniref:Peptidase S41 n=1 Tax=Solibacter usitatus (strain Ellin6076) TaxID=234267 RepID=Q028G2_SOLUE
MSRFLLALVLAALCRAQNTPALERVLNFEAGPTGDAPTGWGLNNASVSLDNDVVHGGKWAVRIERSPGAGGDFGGISKMIPVDFAGHAIEMRGFLRCQDVTEHMGMWLRLDGEGNSPLGFDSIQRLLVKGTTEWKEYAIKVPASNEGRRLYFGVFVAGSGKVWADDLQLLVDGKPVWEAPKMELPKTVIDSDHEFDGGSRISVSSLSELQIDNLAMLGKVWGFVKYHHPLITSGQRHWDYELFRIVPAILAVPDRAAANAAINKWAAGVGEIAPCTRCARLEQESLQLRPELAWIDDKARLGDNLAATLRKIYANRPVAGTQFYLTKTPGVGNPSFQHELPYAGMRFPDSGFQMLALFRYWNIIEYWFPNRDIIGENWDDVLKQTLPKIVLAKDRDTYQLEMMALIARIHDSHANLWSSLALRPPVGACQLPVNLRFVENQAVVTGYSAEAMENTSGLKVGDVIADLDGVPVAKLVQTWTPYYAASNEPTRLRDIARSMTRGECGAAKLRVFRGTQEVTLQSDRVPLGSLKFSSSHDRPGETYQRLSSEVAYIKMSSIKNVDIPRYIDSAAGTKGLIIDIRNYPSDFVVFTLGQLLVTEKTEFVRFTSGDLANPGAFHWGPPLALNPQKPHYAGKVVILVDEVSQSNAEYTTMAFRSATGATVIGSTTAGADGNVSQIPLPGGLSTMISGIGVFYPDKRPTQRVGIVPDIEVKPTIAGILAGRDELLEAAIAEILKK